MKIYLDTNIIFGFFRNLLLEKRRGRKFTEPAILKFLKQDKFELYTSVLVKAEIARRLRTEWGTTATEVEDFWNLLKEYLSFTLIETATIMNSERFLRLFHVFEDFVYERLKVLELNLPAPRRFDFNALTSQNLNLMWHTLMMHLKVYKTSSLW